MTLGIAVNPYAPNVSRRLLDAADQYGIATRSIDLPTLTLRIDADGATSVADQAGVVEVDSLAPYLLFGFPVAQHALRSITRAAFTQNPVDAVLLADDKAATAERLATAGLPQVPSRILPDDADLIASEADLIGFPVVLKRTHGAQGRWVRRADDASSLRSAMRELALEGTGALVLQPEIIESRGSSIRAVLTGSALLAVTQRTAAPGDWRSNISGGGSQRNCALSPEEEEITLAAAAAMGLAHAGVDLLRSSVGTRVLEINACPDFTSMLPFFARDLTMSILKLSLRAAST